MTREMTHPRGDDEDRQSFDELAPQGEARAFAPDELIACPACRRANAPVRMRCLYCGAGLPVATGAADQRRPVLRALEAWEQGYNVVLRARAEEAAELSHAALAEAARLVRIEPEQLSRMLAAHAALPLARAATREEAALVEHKLPPLGLCVEIVSDEALAVETRPPQRVRRFEFDAVALTAWAGAEGPPLRVAWADVVLLVVGRISRRQIEVEERRGRRAAGEVVETREFYNDEGVLDLYAHDRALNWRVKAEGFDYTCLGARKALTAAENFTRLVAELRTRAAGATFDEDYTHLRHLLQAAWPAVEQTSSGGLRRAGPGRLRTEAVTSVSNETQFTRYSRLRRHFI